MARLEVKHRLGRDDIAAVTRLLDAATEVDRHAPLGEHRWLDLVHGGREGFAGLVVVEEGHDHPVGYAQVSRDRADRDASWAVEFVVDPHQRDEMPGIGRTLVDAALDVVRAEGGGHVHLWVPKPGPVHDAIASAAGLRRGRELRQLRRPLPLPIDASERGQHGSAGIELRPFRPGEDEDAWLDVNNRAFRRHPEQGGWNLETLRSREGQPWFDPSGLLLHERDGRLAGFCWTKVHPDSDPPLGEIYVIAVDPDFQGLGLGRSLTVAGLERLSARGLDWAMLYVDGDNAAALRLYESIGFTVDHVDRAYVGDIAPAPQPTPPSNPTSDPTP